MRHNVSKILVNYLQGNGVKTIGGPGDALDEADTEINDTDKEVIDDFRSYIAKLDFYYVTMLVCLIIVFIVMIYLVIQKSNDLLKLSSLIGVILAVIGMMHKIWRDKERSRTLIKILPLLEKKDRIKAALAILDKKGEADFGKISLSINKPSSVGKK